MKDLHKKFNGRITRYDPERYFGFIAAEGGSYFFSIEKANYRERKNKKLTGPPHKFGVGDEVAFELKRSEKRNDELVAYNLVFIRNEAIEQLIDEAKKSDILQGFLKLNPNKKPFIKHKQTYVSIPLAISDWEIDLAATYFNRVNELIEFRLTQTENPEKLSAILCDRKFCKEYSIVSGYAQSAEIIEAKVTGRNAHGLFVLLLDGTLGGFITLSKEPSVSEKLEFAKLKKADVAKVTVKHIGKKKSVVVRLAEG